MPNLVRGRTAALAAAVALLAAGAVATRSTAATAPSGGALYNSAQASAGAKAYATNCFVVSRREA